MGSGFSCAGLCPIPRDIASQIRKASPYKQDCQKVNCVRLNNLTRKFENESEDDNESDSGKSLKRSLLPFARAGQSTVEEFGSGAIGADPIAPAQQVVNFVGDD